MANHLEPSSSTQTADREPTSSNSSALHHLIRKLTRFPTTLRTLALPDTHNHHDHHPSKSSISTTNPDCSSNYKLILNKNHPLRKLIPSLFLSDPSNDPDPETSQLSLEAESMSNESCRKRRMDNLVLDGFLKNNGGYLDDSESSSASSDLDDTNHQTISSDEEEQDQPEHHPHNLNILAKKYQPDTATITTTTTYDGMKTSTFNQSNFHPHQSRMTSNLSKRLLHLHLSNKSDHRKSAMVVLNKPIDHQAYPAPHDHHSHKSSKDTYDDNYTHIKHIERASRPAQEGRFDRLTNNTHPKRPDSLNSQAREDHARQPEGGRYQHMKPRWYGAAGERYKSRETGGQEDEEAGLSFNLKYLRSSTFPTKNSILDSPCNELLHPSPRTFPSCSSSSSIVSPIDHELRHHHPDFDQFKSPFRNLILGQDDLLRSN